MPSHLLEVMPGMPAGLDEHQQIGIVGALGCLVDREAIEASAGSQLFEIQKRTFGDCLGGGQQEDASHEVLALRRCLEWRLRLGS
jgi:hypothetical protein